MTTSATGKENKHCAMTTTTPPTPTITHDSPAAADDHDASECSEKEANHAFMHYVTNNNWKEVLRLLRSTNPVDPSADDNYAIQVASESGQSEVVGLLLRDRRVDPSAYHDDAIKRACEHGHAEVVRLLLQDGRADPSVNGDHAIECASANGHVEVVRLLLNDGRADPSAEDNSALVCACRNGHADVVRLLMQDDRVDPSATINHVLQVASQQGHAEVVRLLLQSARVARLALQSSFDWTQYLTLDEMGLLWCHAVEKPVPTTTALASQGELFCSMVVNVLRDQSNIPDDLTRCVIVPLLTGFPFP
jgi:ankyrin repeat protein